MPRTMISSALSLFWLACLFAAPAQAQEDCKPVSFAPGPSTLELSGTAPPDDVVCFALAGLSGRDLSVAVSQGINIIFSIYGLIDAQDRYRFTAAQDRYRILVGQFMRSVAPEHFRIRVSLSNTREGSNATPPVGMKTGVPGAGRGDDPPPPTGDAAGETGRERPLVIEPTTEGRCFTIEQEPGEAGGGRIPRQIVCPFIDPRILRDHQRFPHGTRERQWVNEHSSGRAQ